MLLAAFGLFLLTARVLAVQAQPPWLGIWTLNAAKSSAGSSSRYKKVTFRIQATTDNGLKVIYEMVGKRGGTTHMEWTGKFDGKDYAIQGADYVLTNAYSMLDDHSYAIVVKVDDAIVARTKVVVSPEGQTLTTVTTETNVKGQTVPTTAVYDKL